jgi:hypothetical protein
MSDEQYPSVSFIGGAEGGNSLLRYIHDLHPDVISQLSQPENTEAVRVIEQNVMGLLGHLPTGQFNVEVTTSRENLGRLLASAMMSGYFLRNAEQRFAIEQSFGAIAYAVPKGEDLTPGTP